jgi:hypothetical protein
MLEYEIPETGKTVPVPAGFVTDFATTPWLVWSVFPPWGKYGPAAVVHDYLYWDQQCTKEQADSIFLKAMDDSSVGWKKYLIHAAVAVFGRSGWEENIEIRGYMKTREIPSDILRKMNEPSSEWYDPTITWEQLQNKLLARGSYPKRRPSDDKPPDYCAAFKENKEDMDRYNINHT